MAPEVLQLLHFTRDGSKQHADILPGEFQLRYAILIAECVSCRLGWVRAQNVLKSKRKPGVFGESLVYSLVHIFGRFCLEGQDAGRMIPIYPAPNSR